MYRTKNPDQPQPQTKMSHPYLIAIATAIAIASEISGSPTGTCRYNARGIQHHTRNGIGLDRYLHNGDTGLIQVGTGFMQDACKLQAIDSSTVFFID